MRKYIKSKSGNLVYTIERQSFTETFRIPENYFQHATRNVWYSTTGFNMFVQYKGAFYLIDRTDAHGYITSLEFAPITAEEAAAAKMERAAQAMSEAQEHEAKTAAAALDYDTETAEAEAREARFAADYAAALAKDAAELAAEAGTSNAASIADITAEYAERARRYATSAEETAERNAAELAERAEIIAAIEDPEERTYIEAEAIANRWSPEETAEEIKYRHDARARKQAEPATVTAYEYDLTTTRTASGYRCTVIDRDTGDVDEIATAPTATEAIERAAALIDAAFVCDETSSAHDAAAGIVALALDKLDAAGIQETPEQRARLEEYARDYVKASPRDYWEDEPDDEPAPRDIYQRFELLAYLGEPDAYDVDAIEAEATEYDPKTGRTYWRRGVDLAAIAERHELYQYAAI